MQEVHDGCHAWQQARKQLVLQASSLQSDVKRELCGSRQELAVELRNFAKKEEEDRQSWEQDLWSDLGKLRKQLSVLGSNVRIAGPEELRKMVGAVEHKLKVYSEQRRLELQDLCAEECRLEESLQASVARFDAWEANGSAASVRAHRRPSSAPQRRLKTKGTMARSQELRGRVEEISQQLATPRDGGWRQADHEAFLRLLLGRFRGRPSGGFLAEAQELLPHLAHEQLVEHSKWLLEQDALQAERQSLLQQWRTEKSSKGPESATLASEVAKESAQKREAEMKKRHSIAEKKKQVEAWQKERAEAARAEQEKQREAEEEEKRKAKRRQEALQAKKEEMECWRKQKEMPRKNEASAAQVTAAPLTAQQILRLRARSEQLLRNRERQRAEKLVNTTCERDEFVRSEAYSHIPGRLNSSTQQYILRARQCRDEDSEVWSCRGVVPGNFAHQGLLRTMRAAPAWRSRS